VNIHSDGMKIKENLSWGEEPRQKGNLYKGCEGKVSKPSHQIEVSGQLHVSAVLPLVLIGKEAPEPFFRRGHNYYLFVWVVCE
jgi:hypothetical protein